MFNCVVSTAGAFWIGMIIGVTLGVLCVAILNVSKDHDERH